MAIDPLCSIFADLVNEALDSDDADTQSSSILNHILAAEGVDKRDKIVALIDLVAGGIETVTSPHIISLFQYSNTNQDI